MKKFVAMFTAGMLLGGSAFAEIGNSARVVDAGSFIRYENAALTVPQNAGMQKTFAIDFTGAQAAFRQASPSLELKDFPVGLAETGTIELKASRSIFDANTKWTVNNKYRVAAPDVVTYHGKVNGEEDSRVILNYGGGIIHGVVQRANGLRYTIAPTIEQNSPDAVHMIVADQYRMMDDNQSFVCATPTDYNFTESKESKPGSKELNAKANLRDSLLEARVEIEASSTYYSSTGGSGSTEVRRQKALRYLHDLWAMVSRIYEDEINTTIYITAVNLIDDPEIDEYPGMLDNGLVSGTVLNRVKDYWNNYKAADPNDPNVRHIGHVMMGPPITGGPYVAGIALRNTLCDRQSCYSITTVKGFNRFPTANYSDDASTVAHEVGHNFIAPHTHDCGYWNKFTGGGALDSCITLGNLHGAPEACIPGPSKRPALGTIMSYCHLGYENTMKMTFGDIVSKVMRRGFDTNGTGGAEACLQPPAQPTVRVEYPYGNYTGSKEQIFNAGSTQTIRWTTSRVGTVTLQYSTNNGQSWTDIQANVPAAQRKFDWTVPAHNSVTALIRAVDPVSGAADTSYAVFEIRAKSVTLAAPAAGAKVPQREKFTISWIGTLVDSVRIEYSVDNGPWTLISKEKTAPNGNTSTYGWTVPATINSQNVRIRVVSTQEEEIAFVSAPFSVAPAVADITSPTPGTEIRFSSNTWPSSYRVEFNADYVNRVRLEYSTNGGQKWEKLNTIPASLQADRGYFDWSVPKPSTPDQKWNLLIRIVNNFDSTELDRVGEITVPVKDEPVSAVSAAIGMSLAPNPVADQAELRISSLKSFAAAEILIVGEDGRIVERLANRAIAAGEETIHLNMRNISQGAYTLVLRAGTEQLSIPLQIVR